MTTTRFDRVARIAGADDWGYDVWGTSIGLFFDIASVLDMTDVAGDVTPQPFDRWQYSRAPFTVPDVESVAARADAFAEGEFADDYTYGQVSLASAYVSGEVTQDDLIYAGDVLSRYTDILRRNGKDYWAH
jgi:hypothetical protein